MPARTPSLKQQRRKDEQIYPKSPQWTAEVQRLKGHFSHDPYIHLKGMWSVLPPPHQLVIAGQVAPVTPII